MPEDDPEALSEELSTTGHTRKPRFRPECLMLCENECLLYGLEALGASLQHRGEVPLIQFKNCSPTSSSKIQLPEKPSIVKPSIVKPSILKPSIVKPSIVKPLELFECESRLHPLHF